MPAGSCAHPKGSNPMTSFRAAGLVLAAILLVPGRLATGQSYPDRPVKIVVPVGPAGSYDIVGRLLADQLTKRLGQSVVVENRPGDQPSVPGQDGGRQGRIRQLAEGLAAQSMCNLSKRCSLRIREPQPPAQLAPQDPVFR